MTADLQASIRRLRFPEELEKAFRHEYLKRHLGHLRAVLVVAMIIGAIMGAPLPLIPPETQARAMLVAFGVIIPCSLFVLAFSHSKHFLKYMQLSTGAVSVIFGASILWFWAQEELSVYAAYGLANTVFVTFGIYTLLRMRFQNAVITAWTLGAIALYYVYLFAPLPPLQQMRHALFVLMTNVFGMLACYFGEVHMRREFLLQRELDAERAKSETLLLNVLPETIAARLKQDTTAIAEDHEEATVLFADIVDFTRYSAGRPAVEVVSRLDEVFTCFDRLADRYELEKIKTVGDAYMVVGGVPSHRDDHCEAVADFALAVLREMASINENQDIPFAIRIGIHCGPVVAGVIGKKRFLYDLWGDTVNTASRMESHGLASHIQVTEAVAKRLEGKYRLESRGTIEVKSKGPMTTYLLGERVSAPTSYASLS